MNKLAFRFSHYIPHSSFVIDFPPSPAPGLKARAIHGAISQLIRDTRYAKKFIRRKKPSAFEKLLMKRRSE